MQLPPDDNGEIWLVATMNDVTELVDNNELAEPERAFRFVAENKAEAASATSNISTSSVRHLL